MIQHQHRSSTPAHQDAPLQQKADAVEQTEPARRGAVMRKRAPLQMLGDGKGGDTDGVRAAAARGISGGTSTMPHRETIQSAFGHHDLGGVHAHVGGAAAEGAAAMGAHAYATGNHVAFAESPDLHTAAHEAAHIVQQRAGVQLEGGVGQLGDPYERHADAVADEVVGGHAAEALLDAGPRGGSAAQGPVQRKAPASGGQKTSRLGGPALPTTDPTTGDTKLKVASLTLWELDTGVRPFRIPAGPLALVPFYWQLGTKGSFTGEFNTSGGSAAATAPLREPGKPVPDQETELKGTPSAEAAFELGVGVKDVGGIEGLSFNAYGAAKLEAKLVASGGKLNVSKGTISKFPSITGELCASLEIGVRCFGLEKSHTLAKGTLIELDWVEGKDPKLTFADNAVGQQLAEWFSGVEKELDTDFVNQLEVDAHRLEQTQRALGLLTDGGMKEVPGLPGARYPSFGAPEWAPVVGTMGALQVAAQERLDKADAITRHLIELSTEGDATPAAFERRREEELTAAAKEAERGLAEAQKRQHIHCQGLDEGFRRDFFHFQFRAFAAPDYYYDNRGEQQYGSQVAQYYGKIANAFVHAAETAHELLAEGGYRGESEQIATYQALGDTIHYGGIEGRMADGIEGMLNTRLAQLKGQSSRRARDMRGIESARREYAGFIAEHFCTWLRETYPRHFADESARQVVYNEVSRLVGQPDRSAVDREFDQLLNEVAECVRKPYGTVRATLDPQVARWLAEARKRWWTTEADQQHLANLGDFSAVLFADDTAVATADQGKFSDAERDRSIYK